MISAKALVRPVVFVPLAFLVFALIGYAGPRLKRKHFVYTSAGDISSSRSIFPLNQKLTLLKPDRVSGAVLLSALAKNHPGGLILNFWATWCPPCVEELPSLELLARQLDARKDSYLPQIVAISVDEKPQDVFGFFRTLDFHSSLQLVHDKDGMFARSIGTVRFPETYWVNPSGAVLYKWVGPQNWVSADILERIALFHKVDKR